MQNREKRINKKYQLSVRRNDYMFAIYEYKEITSVSQVRDILEDICTLVTYVPSEDKTTNDAKTFELWQKLGNAAGTAGRNSVIQYHTDAFDQATHLKTADYAPKIYCSVDPNWKNASQTSTGSTTYLVTTQNTNEFNPAPTGPGAANAGTKYHALLTAGSGTFEKMVNLSVTEPKNKPGNFTATTVATTLLITGYGKVVDMAPAAEAPAPADTVEGGAAAATPSIVVTDYVGITETGTPPEIYWNGGYLYISATENQLLIASLNNARKGKRWVPGNGVVDFWPYATKETNTLSDTDSYYSNGKYSTCLYLSMNGLNNLYVFKRYSVIAKDNQIVPKKCQIKNPYVSSIEKGVSIALPANTVNSNWSPALYCAKIEFQNRYETDLKEDQTITKDNKFQPHYDVGGDISKMTPLHLTKNGKSLDTLDLLMPLHDTRPMDQTSKEYTDMLADEKAKYPIDITTLSADDQVKYKNYYGLCMLWGSSAGSLASPGLKYVVRMG